MKVLSFIIGILSLCQLQGQITTASELLENSIAYHDPQGSWPRFKGELNVTMTTPDETERVSHIVFDLPKEYFHLTAVKDGITISQKIDKDDCELSLNGSTQISDKDIETHRLTCERAHMYKDYYTYLYGLPMKLKDPGTILDPVVTTKTFKGKKYLVLKVNYANEVGKDTWYFYFDPSSYAMEAYQFFHEESENDGEYILLSGEVEIGGIKMPATRAWYYNKDDKYLGTDVLLKASSVEE